VTVEPGIYILEELEGIPAKYRGIGIRIEDDVLVTKTGNEVLTSMIPKSIEDIEAKMNQVNKIKQGTQQKFAGATV
jgi:Xaa-Pro aminopeptidase